MTFGARWLYKRWEGWMAKRKMTKAVQKAKKAGKAKTAKLRKVARDLAMPESVVREVATRSKVADLAIDFSKPLEPQADRLAALLVRDLPTEFALLPEKEFVTNDALPPDALQPGFVALTAPIIDRMDDGSSYEFHGAAIMDGQLVFQGRRRERAATSRVLGMAKGRSFSAMLQEEQKRAGLEPAAVPADKDAAPVAPPTGGTSMAVLEQAGLAKAGTALEGRFFRLPTTTDGGGVERVRSIAEYVILCSLGIHTSTRLSNMLEKSSIDFDDRTGKSVERVDRKQDGLYPGGGGGGGLY